MKAKEKAKDLVDKFSNEVLIDNYEAKLCALIAVVEVMCEVTDEDDFSWWNKVKQEIELL